MKLDLGKSLLYLGDTLPGVGQSIDNVFAMRRKYATDDEDRRRQAEKDALSAQLMKQNIDSGNLEAQEKKGDFERKQEALKALSGLQATNNDFGDFQSTIDEYKAQGAKPLPGSAVSSSLNQSPLDRATNAVGQYRGTSEDADKYLKGLEDQEKIKASGGGSAKVYAIQRRQIAENDPAQAIRAQKALDSIKGNTGVDPYLLDLWQTMIDSGDPIGAVEAIEKKYGATQEGLRSKKEAIPIAIEQAGGTASASTAGRETTSRKIQRENPILSEPASNSIGQSYSAIKYLNRIKTELKNGNVDYFDIDKKTGQFKNPAIADAYIQLVEIVGRKQSGAAINVGEWNSFAKEILNKNFLLTDAGKKQAAQQIEDYLDKFYAAGANVAGDENWYSKYEQRAKNSRKNAEGQQGNWTSEKEKRYQELKKKLGR